MNILSGKDGAEPGTHEILIPWSAIVMGDCDKNRKYHKTENEVVLKIIVNF